MVSSWRSPGSEHGVGVMLELAIYMRGGRCKDYPSYDIAFNAVMPLSRAPTHERYSRIESVTRGPYEPVLLPSSALVVSQEESKCWQRRVAKAKLSGRCDVMASIPYSPRRRQTESSAWPDLPPELLEKRQPLRALHGEEVGHQLYNWKWRRFYLVESDGELLLVAKKVVQGIRRCSCRPKYSVQMEVRRFLPARREWEAATELPGGKALFVGTAASVAVSSSASPGIRKNCVYLAQRDEGMHAIGVYSLGDRETTVLGIAGGHLVDIEPVWTSPWVA
ncbi:hypothetical protein TRIUR3_25301 [Triticum urartu]|uniref:KIB1-4 beta-propeller domain-containing protein n=1 Tax=Triticum urartu TaxID=4572 RepID=M8A1G2_TRIUA|nr:hypothetical protein TRIUR3_25301 [Triticum urartu]